MKNADDETKGEADTTVAANTSMSAVAEGAGKQHPCRFQTGDRDRCRRFRHPRAHPLTQIKPGGRSDAILRRICGIYATTTRPFVLAERGINAMIVCSCNVISDCDVRAVVEQRSSAGSTAQVYRGLGYQPQCGRCRFHSQDHGQRASPIPASTDEICDPLCERRARKTQCDE